MKSRESVLRSKRFQLDEKRRRVAQIETMIAEFARMAGDLDKEIAAEEQRAKISDPNHFAYPTYAKAAAQRRDNLRRSAMDLEVQLDQARKAVDGAREDFEKLESIDHRERGESGLRGEPDAGWRASA